MIDYVQSDENNVFTKPCKKPVTKIEELFIWCRT